MTSPLTFKYKPRRKALDINDYGILELIYDMAAFNHTHEEAASLLGICTKTLQRFLNKHPEAAEAWADGQEMGKASLRRMGYVHAKTDPGTWRFLAKQKKLLAMTDGKEEEADPNKPNKAISAEEAKARVLELVSKLPSKSNGTTARGYAFQKTITLKKN